MKGRTLGIVLVVVGLILLALGLGADAIGIGEGTGIGWKQVSAAVLGAIIAFIGALQLRRS